MSDSRESHNAEARYVVEIERTIYYEVEIDATSEDDAAQQARHMASDAHWEPDPGDAVGFHAEGRLRGRA